MKNKYSFIDKILHQLSLNNEFFKELSFDLEKSLFLKKYNTISPKVIFINGLARSGTTALLNHFVNNSIGTSLTYNSLPFLFMPNGMRPFLSGKKTSPLIERAHGDNIQINENSPEAIDEIFWKFQLKNTFIKQKTLEKHSLNKLDVEEYLNFIKLHLLASGKIIYLTKNNNTILRIDSLLKNKEVTSQFIFTIRDPYSHAKSLLKQHLQFTKIHIEDPFSLIYFNTLGHHEFGLNLKYFNLQNNSFNSQLDTLDPTELPYWLTVWLNYHEYLLTLTKHQNIFLVSFNSLCKSPNETLHELGKRINESFYAHGIKSYQAPVYDKANETNELVNRCNVVYDELLKLCI